ncbi:MAG: DMT family transporter [Bacillota bacterium]|nr:DMT family transporter [Bacillota bacterium]HOA91396.1 DMT family transporter [Bacillota bacterium]HPQ10144.1 DMT family transporter [Bacillota bacterium]HPZ73331.1 DMT family transporter [Bacillota bacterium]HQD77597.1 DMT family transporter [Bacillota bacterium]
MKINIWTNKYTAAVLAIIACVLWGSAFPVLKATYAELNLRPDDVSGRLLLAGARFFLASVMTFIVVRFGMKSEMTISKKWVLPLIFLGIFQTGLQYFFFYSGIAHVSGVKSAILSSIGNFFVVIFAHFIYKNDKLTFAKAFGLLTGFLGIVIVNWTPEAAGMSWNFTLLGEGFMIMSGLTSTVATFGAKRLSGKLNPALINAYQLFFGSLLLIGAGLPGGIQPHITFTPKFWALLIYSAFLSSAAFSIWYNLLKYNKAGEITIYRFVIPISGSLLSALLVPGEKLTVGIVAALVLVALGIATVNYFAGSNNQERAA